MSGTSGSSDAFGQRGRWRVGRSVDVHVGRARRRGRPVEVGGSMGAVMVSTVFVVLLVAAPGQLDAAWQWIRELPLVLEVVAWIVLLPWLLAWMAWQASWALWVRIVVLVALLGGFASSFWRRNTT